MTWPLHADPGAFLGLGTEQGEAPDPDGSRFAILPVPYDLTASWQKGAARAPAAILEVSPQLELYDPLTRCEPWRAGIVTLAPVVENGPPERLADRLQAIAAEQLAAGRTPVGLGGDHSVSIGLIRAQAEHWPGLTVLQLDAHADTRESYEGSPCNHACVMARAREVAGVVQVGLRSLAASEVAGLDPARTFYAHDIQASHDFVDRVVAAIPPGPVYLTVDLDVLDPGLMPATGTPEPGGLSWWQLVDVIHRVGRLRPLVGADVVELMPLPGLRHPDFLAARLVHQILACMVTGPATT